MGGFYNDDGRFIIVDFVDDSVHSLTHPISFLTGQFFTSRCARIHRDPVDW